MDKNLVEIKDIQKLEIPQFNLLDLSGDKLERVIAYLKHKFPKKLKKEVNA